MVEEVEEVDVLVVQQIVEILVGVMQLPYLPCVMERVKEHATLAVVHLA